MHWKPRPVRLTTFRQKFVLIWSRSRDGCVEQGLGVGDMSLTGSGVQSTLLAKGARATSSRSLAFSSLRRAISSERASRRRCSNRADMR
jgi:hypothetical protein